MIAGSGLGLLVSQLNNYTLSPISEERVSEAAGVNSAAGSFGLSFGLAFAGAIMLATLSISFTDMAKSAPCCARRAAAGRPRARGRRRGDEQHEARAAARRPAGGRSGTRSSGSTPTRGRARCRWRCSIPILAGLIGLFNSFRMMRLPDPAPSESADAAALG